MITLLALLTILVFLLKDDSAKWISSWVPRKGDTIKASIKTEAWTSEKDTQIIKLWHFFG